MFKKVYTSRKAKEVDLKDNEGAASVYDFDMEVEEERSLNTFKSGLNNFFAPTLINRKVKLPVRTATPISEWQSQRPALRGLLTENQEMSTSSHSLKQGTSRPKRAMNNDNQISITASRARLGELYGRFAVVTFTSKKIEVKSTKGSEKVLSKWWHLEDLCSFKTYYNFHCDNAEQKANVMLRFHKKRVWGSCSDGCAVEDELADSLVMEIDNQEWVEQQKKVVALSGHYHKVWERLEEAVEVKESISRSPLKELKSNVNIVRNNDSPQSYSTCSRLNEDLPTFDTLIFPDGDLDAVTVTRKDLEILRPKGFLNDTIIDFYIKYLQSKILSKDKNRFYFFNSFFYAKLVDSSKNFAEVDQSKVAYERVRKWTRKVNLFEKDYIFIPVNQSLHWSLIIICHLSNLGSTSDDRFGTPCILHLDSLEGSHGGIEEQIRNYILQAWIEKAGENSGALTHLRYIETKVPQQNNHCDCGTFLLHYVELFLKAAPLHFSLGPGGGFPYFLTREWFKSSEASAKRRVILDLMNQIHRGSDKPDNPPTCITELQAVDEDDGFISSDSEIIHVELVESLQRQICVDMETTAKHFEYLATSVNTKTPSVMNLCDKDKLSGGALVAEEQTSYNSQDYEARPSIVTLISNRIGSDSPSTPLLLEDTPSTFESSTLFSESDSAERPSSMDIQASLDEGEKLYLSLRDNDDQETRITMKRSPIITLSDWEDSGILEGCSQEQGQSITDFDIVSDPHSGGLHLSKRSRYFADVQNHEGIFLEDDWGS